VLRLKPKRAVAWEVALKPEEVLELIHTAPERYDSVRAALHYRGDGATQREIRQRLVRSEVARREFGISPEEASEPIRHPEPDGPFGWRCRAWYAGVYQARVKTTRHGSAWRSTTTGRSTPW
jgi:hypothetical protein